MYNGYENTASKKPELTVWTPVLRWILYACQLKAHKKALCANLEMCVILAGFNTARSSTGRQIQHIAVY